MTDDCIYCSNPGYVLTSEPGARCPEHAKREAEMRAIYARMIPTTEAPRFRYYEHRGWCYCWTTERVEGKWIAMIYDPEGELRIHREFAQRQRAKAQAGKWLAKARSTTTGRLPASMLK